MESQRGFMANELCRCGKFQDLSSWNIGILVLSFRVLFCQQAVRWNVYYWPSVSTSSYSLGASKRFPAVHSVFHHWLVRLRHHPDEMSRKPVRSGTRCIILITSKYRGLCDPAPVILIALAIRALHMGKSNLLWMNPRFGCSFLDFC